MLPTLVGRLHRPSAFSLTRAWTLIRFQSSRTHEPLQILYCGSDHFSIKGLQALRGLQERNPQNISTIDVVCRPDKRVGRGLKTLQSVPIKDFANQLGLPVHQINTFTGWTPPRPYNLVVAVSFGLLVPPRILNAAKYGGINLHPSLLPDLRGPAPIVHTLLKRRSHYGVTLQTMHPTHFDQGEILAQQLGGQVPSECTPTQLIELTSHIGASMLSHAILQGSFVLPHDPVESRILEFDHAPKISPADRQIDWQRWDADEVVLRGRVLGDLWDNETYPRCTGEATPSDQSRVTFSGPWEKVALESQGGVVEPGDPIPLSKSRMGFATVDGLMVVPASATIASSKKGQGIPALRQKLQHRIKGTVAKL